MPPRAIRILLPVVLILVWLGVGAVGGPYFGRISEVSTNDQTSFLPASSEATQVQGLVGDFSESEGAPGILLVTRDGGLTDEDRAYVEDLVPRLAELESVEGTSPAIPSEDGKAVEIIAQLDGSAEVDEAVGDLREALADGAPEGLDTFVTGPAGFTADLTAAFAGIDGLLLGVALAAVFVILLLVYRSPLLPFLVLGTAIFSLSASILAVWWLAYADVVTINGQVQGILFILVIGAATDYALLYTSRFREALRDHEKPWDATRAALRGSVEPIVASGGTVIAGLLCLLLSDLNSNKALGPVAAIGIAFSVLGALTLLPALLYVFRRGAFWPLRPAFGSTHPASAGTNGRGIWPAVSRLITRHSRPVWVLSTILLLLMSAGLLGLRANGVPQSDLVLGTSEARDGQNELGEHFPGGTGSPAVIVGSADDVDALADAAAGVDGIDSVVAASADSPSGTLPVGTGAPAGIVPGAAPTESGGRVLLQATLTSAADSEEAERTVRELRTAVREVDPGALVGGVTATALDTNETSIHDRTLIIPIVLAVILVILMLLLRSVIAPVLLILSVTVSFAAALGVSALVFDGVFGFPGADPSVPLFAFVFLVALGVDYNIFLMTRVREESIARGTRAGVLHGLSATGGVITSAGIVLAATFAALGVIPILFLAQIAFIVAFGVLLDTLVVRSLLVPALAYDLDRRIWWPSALSRGAHRG
ncbi:MMPL family transporter [Planctomonas deserti]|uniref:MMPL family transporter n=1 Tax=Planctomonas deserti TaxID=2144185 RepID=UPI000D39568D|nr:efflux RND transporter permease subunit [Planctomonas deserti]